MLLGAQLLIYFYWQGDGEHLSCFNSLQQLVRGADARNFIVEQEVVKSTSQFRYQLAFAALIGHQIYNAFGFRQDERKFLKLAKALLLAQKQLQILVSTQIKAKQVIQLPSYLKRPQVRADAQNRLFER